MSEAEARESVHEADTLMSLVDGTAVRVFEVGAQRDETWQEGDKPLKQEVSLSLQVRPTPSELEVRMRAEAERSEARMVADIGVKFRFSTPVEYSEEVSRQFAETLGMPYLLSYIRPILDQLARTLEIPVLSLPPSLTNGNSMILPPAPQ